MKRNRSPVPRADSRSALISLPPRARRLLPWLAGGAGIVLAAAVLIAWDFLGTRAASGEVIVLWDGASIPSGWTCISCSSGDPLFGAFPRASSTYASATSSADTQGHSASFVTSTQGAAQGKNQDAAGTAVDAASHTHTVSGISVVASDIRPPFKNLKFIRAATTTLPNGTIAIFDVASSSLPADWSYYSGMENNYLRADNATSTGGSANHLHSLQATADAVTAVQTQQGGGTQVGVATDHSHSVSGTTPTATNAPPFADVVFGKLAATSSIPTGMIAMFDAAAPSGWEPMSHATGTLNGRFLRGAQTFGATGGSASHSHTTTTVTSGLPSATATTRTGATFQAADDANTHDLTFNNISSETSLPVYRDVVLAKKTETPDLQQRDFRFYANADNLTPSIPLAAENTPVTDVTSGQDLRIRLNIRVATATLATTSQAFHLQFAAKGTASDCVNVTSSLFADIGGLTSSTIWRGVDMGGTADDGDALPSTLLASSTAAGTYEETNPSAGNPVAVPPGGILEYDWAIENNGADSDGSYCFRMAKSDGSGLESYLRMAEVRIVRPLTQTHFRWRNDDGGE